MDVVDRLNEGPPSVLAMRDGAEEIMRLRSQREDLRIRLQRAEARYLATVEILSGIHRLLLPGEFEGHDGKVYRFDPPDDNGLYKECYRALGDRIRAIPEELDKAANTEMSRERVST